MEIPEELKEERDELVALVYKAFDGVTREGGVSWSQADAIDDYCSDDEIQAAGEKDTDSKWEELVGHEMFTFTMSNWSFLDAIGFRYYLAPQLIACLNGEDGSAIEDRLRLAKGIKWLSWIDKGSNYTLEQWSVLDGRQRACIAEVLLFMSKWEQSAYPEYGLDGWKKAHDSYWAKFSK